MSGKDIIHRLRNEKFNIETESKLENHPYIKTAEKGMLTKQQKLAFCYEQYAIQRSDAISFAFLAGHTNFKPKSLSGIQIPSPPPIVNEKKENEKDEIIVPDLFQFLLGGEIIAAPLLLKYAKFLFDNEEENEDAVTTKIKVEEQLSKYETSPLAQAYPSYWARIALEGSTTSRIAGAAACAVNFPAWGRMCSRLYDALLDNVKNKEGGNNNNTKEVEEHIEFIKFFATPIDNLDEMAAAIIDNELKEQKQQQQGNDDTTVIIDYDTIKNHVRLLQQYEVYFWDAIYD